MAEELAHARLPPLQAQGASNEALLTAITTYLFIEKGITPPLFGRSNIPNASIVQNAGVWEDARLGYLNHALVSHRGIPAVLSILLADILQRLLIMGAIDFVARIDASDLSVPPRAEVLPGVDRAGAVRMAGTEGRELVALNTCTLETVVECLRYLKRSYVSIFIIIEVLLFVLVVFC